MTSVQSRYILHIQAELDYFGTWHQSKFEKCLIRIWLFGLIISQVPSSGFEVISMLLKTIFGVLHSLSHTESHTESHTNILNSQVSLSPD